MTKKMDEEKFMEQSRKTVSKIGKGDEDKIDTSKMKMRVSDNDKSLAQALRFRLDVHPSVSDATILKQYRRQGINADLKKKEQVGKKAGGAKMEKKSIMELPTNVPRLMRGALLGDLDKDGKMSGYETARQKAIEKSMKEQKGKKAKSGLAVGIAKIKNK